MTVLKRAYETEKSEKEIHQESLEASAEMAREIKKIQFNNPRLTYAEATEIYEEQNSSAARVQRQYTRIPGEEAEPEEEAAPVTSWEAGRQLAAQTNDLMYKRRCSYMEASEMVFRKKENQRLVKAYQGAKSLLWREYAIEQYSLCGP